MTSLLLPVAVGSCQLGLRERRRSSFNGAAHILSSAISPKSSEDSEVFVDDVASTDQRELPAILHISELTPLPSAQKADHCHTIMIPRHQNNLPLVQVSHLSSPSSTSGTKTILTPAEDVEGADGLPSFERMSWRLAAGYFAYFMCGWGDGVTGTVLPYFVAEFNVSFMMSSLLYAGSTFGFMLGTAFVERIINYLGAFPLERQYWSRLPMLPRFSKEGRSETGYSTSQARLLSLIISSTLHGMFFVMMGTRGGFWVLFSAYAVAAFARSMLTASLNAYYANVKPASIGYAFAFWSLGGAGAPLVCQALIAAGVPWFKFYFGSLVLSALNVAFLTTTFRPTTNEFRRDREMALVANKLSSPSTPTNDDKNSMSIEDVGPKPRHTLRWALLLPYQWAICIFAILYCGCETSTQSFMVTYLLGTRHANPKTVGYVTSGFWGGITVGRLVGGYYTEKLTYVQRRFVILSCLLFAFAMQLLIWLVKSNVGNSVATALIGVAYGPLFPACLTLANDILPFEIRLVSMALISASGSLGAAILPFVAGTLSSTHGVHYLPYLNVPLAGLLSVLWFLFPSQAPKRK